MPVFHDSSLSGPQKFIILHTCFNLRGDICKNKIGEVMDTAESDFYMTTRSQTIFVMSSGCFLRVNQIKKSQYIGEHCFM